MTRSDREMLKERLADKVFNSQEDGYMTSKEISKEMGWPEKRTLEKLRELKETGELEIKKVPRFNLADTISMIPGYRLKKDES